MNYDITFCRNDKCSLRHDCHRWLHYQVYKKDRNRNKKTLISMFEGIGGKECLMFWREQNTTEESYGK